MGTKSQFDSLGGIGVQGQWARLGEDVGQQAGRGGTGGQHESGTGTDGFRKIHGAYSVELSCLLSMPASIMHDITWRAYGGPSLRVAQVTGNAIVSFFKQVVG